MNHQAPILLFLISLNLLLTFKTVGQTMITGAIINEQGNPLPYVNVVLLSAPDSNFVVGTITNDGGLFELTSHAKGKYILYVNSLAYESRYLPIRAQESTLVIPEITLIEDGITLNTIEITTEKPLITQSIDRTIINLENRVAKMGISILDLLEKLPGVIVDRQNESISILGKDGLQLLINNRQQYLSDEALFNYLSGLNADNLQTIELITTPPANFDAEGNAGFINLELKQYPEDGWNGNYAFSAGYGNGETLNGSFDLNLRKKRLAMSANYSVSHHGQGQFSSYERRVGVEEQLLGTNARIERDPYVNTHNLRLVTDYQINDKTRMGSSLTTYLRNWNMDATYDILFQTAKALDTLVDATLFEENDWKSLQGNLNFNHAFNKNTNISVDLDYLWYNNENPINYDFNYQLADGIPLPGFHLESEKSTPFVIQVARVDLQNKVSAKLKWSTGLKASHASFENDVEVLRNQSVLPAFASLSELREIVGVIYTQFDYQVSEKVQIKGGLRYEYTDTDLSDGGEEQIVDREFGALFPTLYAQIGSFNLAYSKRINRPSFREMAPFQIFVGPNTSNAGNPALQAAISQNISANYRWKTINFNLQYTREDSTIASFQNQFDPQTNTQTILPRNLQKEEYISFSISGPITITDWWTFRFFVDYFYIEAVTREALGTFQFSQGGYSANVSQFLSLPKEWTFEISAFYRSVGLNGNVQTQPYGGISFGLQKTFANGARLALNVSDLLESIYSRGITDLPDQYLFVDRLADFSNRTLRVSYRHSFGNKQVKRIQQNRQAEERKRVN